MKWHRRTLLLITSVVILSGCIRTNVEGTFVPTGKTRNDSPAIPFSGLASEFMGGPVSVIFKEGTVDFSLLPLGPHPFEVREDKIWVFHPVQGSEIPFFRIRDAAHVVDLWGATYRLIGNGNGAREQVDWLATGGLAGSILALTVSLTFLGASIKRTRNGKTRPSKPKTNRPQPPPRPKSIARSGLDLLPSSFKKPDFVFLSKTEKHCLIELARAGGDRLLVFPKVHPAALLTVHQADESMSVDLLLCDPDSLEPFAAIQLVENRLREEKPRKAFGEQLRGQGILFEAVSPTTFYNPARLENLISDLLRKRHRGLQIDQTS